MRFCGDLQKHKTRFIISYTAQNRLHSVFLETCLKHCDCVARARTGLADSRHARPVARAARRADRIAPWSKISGLDLARLGTTATAEEITDTAVTQPLVVAATLLASPGIDQRADCSPAQRDLSSPAIRSASSPPTPSPASSPPTTPSRSPRPAAPRWPRPAPSSPPACRRVLGGDEDEVLARLDDLDLVPANRNAAGQIVAAGALDGAGQTGREPAGEGAGASRWPPRARSTPQFMASGADGYAAAAADVADRRADRHAAVQRRRPAGHLRRRRDDQAGRAGDPAGALGSVHRRRCASAMSRRSSSSRRRARSSASPNVNFGAHRRMPSRPPRTWTGSHEL